MQIAATQQALAVWGVAPAEPPARRLRTTSLDVAGDLQERGLRAVAYHGARSTLLSISPLQRGGGAAAGRLPPPPPAPTLAAARDLAAARGVFTPPRRAPAGPTSEAFGARQFSGWRGGGAGGGPSRAPPRTGAGGGAPPP